MAKTNVTRRTWLVMIGMTLAASCRGAQPEPPPKPQTVTLAIEGMT